MLSIFTQGNFKFFCEVQAFNLKMFRAVIIGAPASGKGTISSRITNCFDVLHLSSGDLLRNQKERGTALGKEAQNYISSGKLVPDEIITRLVMSELSLIEDKSWLLDGYPRTRIQAETLLSKYQLNLALVLHVPTEEIIERVKGRWIHLSSGRVYNETFNQPKEPGKDDITGEALIQRPDDAPDAVRHRLELYHKTISPLLELYEERKILERFHGRTSDEIWPNVKNSISKFLTPLN